jgi:nucleotide-binding universal stress UspA family protein
MMPHRPDQLLCGDQTLGRRCHTVGAAPTSDDRDVGIKRIVVGVDGSPVATAAARWAASEAAMRGVDLTVVHVAQPAPEAWLQTGWPAIPVPTEVVEHQLGQGEKILAGTLEVIAKTIGPRRPRSITTKLRVGAVVPILSSFTPAESHMIVVGRRRRGGIHRTLLGSVSSAMLHAAQCPVTVVHDHIASARPSGAPIVVGVDCSAASTRATAIAFDEASRRAANVVAVHAIDGPHTSQAQELLTHTLSGFEQRHPDVGVRRVIVGAQPADALLDESRAAQLVVVGGSGRSGLTDKLRGSVSAAVVQACRIPVIVASRHIDSKRIHHRSLPAKTPPE